MRRFHTIEKITDYGVNQVLFKKGNKILAFAEDRFGKWLYWFGKPSKNQTWVIGKIVMKM